jgi:nitrite reductase/ring-hydroxylating ferredoxin subunit
MTFFARPPHREDRPGTRLCNLAEIPEGTGKGFELTDRDGRVRAIFVVRWNGRVVAYRNVCPHAGTPLDFKPDTFLAPDGETIQCATHGARFRIEDGACIAGPCNGKGLTGVAVEIDANGAIVLTHRSNFN